MVSPESVDNPNESQTPLVDELIERAAYEIAQQDWPGLWDTDPSTEDIERVHKQLQEFQGE